MTMTRPTSEQITFTGAGVGAQQRLLVDKVRETVSVKDFGAVGDGVTDDTAAIQAAIDWHKTLPSAQKAQVKISLANATYVISGVIMTQDNNGLVFCDGALARKTGTGLGPNDLLYARQDLSSSVALSNITLENIEFQGSAQYTRNDPSGTADNAANQANFQWCNAVSFSTLQPDPALRGVRNIVCRNLRVSGMGKNAIVFNEPEGCAVDGLYVTRCNDHAVAVTKPATNPNNVEYSMIVNNLVVEDSSTLFDFAGDSPTFDPQYAVAVISNCAGKTIRGRTKIAGPWTVTISNMSVSNKEILIANRIWGALAVATQYCGNLQINGMNCLFCSSVRATTQLLDSHLSMSNVSVAKSHYTGITTGFKTSTIVNYSAIDTYQPLASFSGAEHIVLNGFCFADMSADWAESAGGLLETNVYPLQINATKSVTIENGSISGFGSNSVYTNNGISQPPAFVGYFVAPRVSISNVTFEDPRANVGTRVIGLDTGCTYAGIHNVSIPANASTTTGIRNAASTCRLLVTNSSVLTPTAVTDLAGYDGALMTVGAAKHVGYASAAPTTGTWRRGDIIYNNTPSSAGHVGWVCTAAGTPGTWNTFGLIS